MAHKFVKFGQLSPLSERVSALEQYYLATTERGKVETDANS